MRSERKVSALIGCPYYFSNRTRIATLSFHAGPLRYPRARPSSISALRRGRPSHGFLAALELLPLKCKRSRHQAQRTMAAGSPILVGTSRETDGLCLTCCGSCHMHRVGDHSGGAHCGNSINFQVKLFSFCLFSAPRLVLHQTTLTCQDQVSLYK